MRTNLHPILKYILFTFKIKLCHF